MLHFSSFEKGDTKLEMVTYPGQCELWFCVESFAHYWFPVCLIHICQGLEDDKRNRKVNMKRKHKEALDKLRVMAL